MTAGFPTPAPAPVRQSRLCDINFGTLAGIAGAALVALTAHHVIISNAKTNSCQKLQR
jgi:hypothetical protein